MKKTIWALFFFSTITHFSFAGTGEDTYKEACANCHASGLAGAPKVGDPKAWGKLIQVGQVPLTAEGFNGVRAMPAKGGRSELTVGEFASAVVYMANQSGANWQAPNETMLRKITTRIDKLNRN